METSNHHKASDMTHSQRHHSPPAIDGGATTGASMNSILLFLRADTAFEPEILAFMGRAFDLACANLPDENNSPRREEIAMRIISLAKRGVRDPQQLYEGALTSASYSQMSDGTTDSCHAAPAKVEQTCVLRDTRGVGS
jgi:hypothetical protein